MIFYLIAINVVALTAMGIDKVRSMTDTKRRIPEKRLFLYVLLGGGFGGCLGMMLYRHKTKHKKFKILFPLITIVEYGVPIFILNYSNLTKIIDSIKSSL